MGTIKLYYRVFVKSCTSDPLLLGKVVKKTLPPVGHTSWTQAIGGFFLPPLYFAVCVLLAFPPPRSCP